MALLVENAHQATTVPKAHLRSNPVSQEHTRQETGRTNARIAPKDTTAQLEHQRQSSAPMVTAQRRVLRRRFARVERTALRP